MMDIVPTTILGQITKSYGDGFYAIKPLGKIKDVELEPIPRVPMCQLGNSSFKQLIPFKVGDIVPIAFLTYSQSNYLENDDIDNLDSDITNNLVDCIAYPFLIPTSANVINAQKIEITGDMTIQGNLAQTGDLTATNIKETSNGVDLGTHKHKDVTVGADLTGGPV